jgi:hypothetical protein
MFFFFKQKTAYEIVSGDWSSDVCSSDLPEQLLESEGPVVIGTSRSMERGLREMGEMTKYNIIQYEPTGAIEQKVGADQIPQTVFDYDPDSLIPSHLPGEDTTRTEVVDGESRSVPVASSQPRDLRARQFADNLEYIVVPHSLHEIAQNRERLTLLALMNQGKLQIDPETLSQKFDVPNWGSLDGSTIMDKVLSWAKKQLEMKAELAKTAQGLGLTTGDEGGGEGGGESHKGTGGPKGRPASNKKQPQLKQKGLANATPGRAVVTTS